jgi:5-formyltetrahydrofolate cyclo-ligase
MMQEKARLRSEYRKRRRGMAEADYAAANDRITERLLGLDVLQGAHFILSYIAHGREADTRAALAQLAGGDRIVITPGGRNAEEALRCFHFLTPDDPLLDRAWSPAYVPPALCDVVDLAEIEVFIVPGIVWDERGFRIGYGGGYFDRLLAHAAPNATLIGLAYEYQVLPRIPTEEWDIPVHVIVTEERVITAGNQRSA